MDKKIRAISPLALLGLAACNGDDAASVFGGTSSGLAVKGPLANALAFVDTNGNGELDAGETFTRTADGSDPDVDAGSYSLDNPNGAQIVIITDDQTVDTSSGAVLSGIKMIGAADAGVITPLSGIDAGDIDTSALAAALGLDPSIDLLSFNPYADGVDVNDANALAAEKVSQQIVGSLQIISGAIVGSGLVNPETTSVYTTSEAYGAAFDALVELAQTYIDEDKDIDFATTGFLAELIEAAGLEGTTPLIQEQLDDIAAKLAELNGVIEHVESLAIEDTSGAFSAASVVADAYADDIDNANTNVDVAAIVTNAAPTDITLTPADDLSIDETVEGETGDVLVGALAASDDTTAAESIKFELVGDNAELFEIVDGNVVLRDDAEIDFETTETLTVSVKATDTDGKSTAKTFEVAVNDIAEADTMGDVEINGWHMPGRTLWLEDTLTDEDNGEDISNFASKTYQWFADGELIEGQSGNTLQLTDDYVGSYITASITATDQLGEETTFEAEYGNILPDYYDGDVPVVIKITDLVPGTAGHFANSGEQLASNLEEFGDKVGDFMGRYENDVTYSETMVRFDSDGELTVDFGYYDQNGDFQYSGNWMELEFSELTATTLAEFEALVESIDLSDPSTWSIAGQIDEIEFENFDGSFKIQFEEAENADDTDRVKFRFTEKDENGDWIKDSDDISHIGLKGDFDNGLESIIELVDVFMSVEDIPSPDYNDYYDAQTMTYDWAAIDAAWLEYYDAVDEADFAAMQEFLSVQQLEGLYVSHFADENGEYYNPLSIGLFHEQDDGDRGAYIEIDGYSFYIEGDFSESLVEFSELFAPSNNILDTMDALLEDGDLSAEDVAILINGNDELIGLADGGITDLDSIGLYKENEETGDFERVVKIEIDDFAKLIEVADEIDNDGHIDGEITEYDDNGDVNKEYSYVYDTDGLYIVLGEGLDLDTLYDSIGELDLDDVLLAA